MRTIRTMITTAGFPHDRNAQNLRRIKQRKGRCFILASSDDVDDQDDDYDSGTFHDRMHKICVALNKEKSITSFRQWVTMRTIKTMARCPLHFRFYSLTLKLSHE